MGLGKVIKTAKMDIVIKVVGVMKGQRKDKVHNLDVAIDLPYQDIDLKTYEQDAKRIIKEQMKSWSRVELYLSPWTQVDEEGFIGEFWRTKEVTLGDKRYRKISLEVGGLIIGVLNIKENSIDYMSNWIREESWCSLAVISEAAHMGVLHADKYMADYVLSTGAINSSMCYPQFKDTEEHIEGLAEKYRQLSDRVKNKVHRNIFKKCLFITCESCGHVSFVTNNNEDIYPELLKKCWECGHGNISIKRGV